jgi:hypothetical protein
MSDWTARLSRPTENRQTKQRRIRNMRLSQTRLLTGQRHEKKGHRLKKADEELFAY